MIEPITIDFETEAIEGNPIVKPPKPVGAAIWVPGKDPAYLSWGHPSGNNCDFSTAATYLETIARRTKRPLLFQNAGFDLSVWARHLPGGISIEEWRERIHDTMYLLFLADPYASTLSLKPSAARYLGMPPDEQNKLKEWILQNVSEATEKNWGASIALAPGDVVGPYAIGDVIRTRKLFDLLHAKIVTDGMEQAYERERRLFPITVRGTRHGIRINRGQLVEDEKKYSAALDQTNFQLSKLLRIPSESIDETGIMVEAMEREGFVTEWTLTKTGRKSKAKDNLKINNPEVKILYEYKSGLQTCLQTFFRPWIQLSASTGRLHPNWNQVKQPNGDRASLKGTQTGRLSSDSPNFQNVPTEFTYKDGSPLLVPVGMPPMPLMRGYCLPEVGHVWIKRDFSSQEIRILAHFEDGSLCEAYRGNPDLDPHEMAKGIILVNTGQIYERKSVKITGFSIIYGSGIPGLSHQLAQPPSYAASIKSAYLRAMPDVKDLMDEVKAVGKAGLPIRTWGGRLYYTEPAKVDEDTGSIRSFEYKLLNYLIQGSAADQTKEAIIDWDERKYDEDIFLATVHDEINASVPQEGWQCAMRRLKESMDADRFDVPFRSEGFVGKNWHEIEEINEG